MHASIHHISQEHPILSGLSHHVTVSRVFRNRIEEKKRETRHLLEMERKEKWWSDLE
jgi:hypothetical protein